jgi:hypothetical protein
LDVIVESRVNMAESMEFSAAFRGVFKVSRVDTAELNDEATC